MTESKHTPGPWRWWTSNSLMRLTCEKREAGRVNQDGGVLHAYRCRDGVADVCVSEADANLIAGAPEMFEALKRCETHMRDHPMFNDPDVGPCDTLTMVRAALAKATGKVPA